MKKSVRITIICIFIVGFFIAGYIWQLSYFKNSIVPSANLALIPTIPDKGVDMSASSVATSTKEREKLFPFLPYEKDYTLSTGLPIEVLIPEKKYQFTPWSLSVQITGIEYNVTKSDADYMFMRDSFREAVKNVFAWIDSKGVDHTKVYVSWGDRAFIQDKAMEWLK